MLDKACREWGCFQLENHNLGDELCHRILTDMERFFSLPLSEKRAVERTAENPWGFYDQELTRNVKDWKEIFDVGPEHSSGPFSAARRQWPLQLVGFRENIEAYYNACKSLALSLLADIGECLGVSRGMLGQIFGHNHSSFLRLNYYPTCSAPEKNLGISSHTDAGALTVMLPDAQAGLQILRNNDWHTVTTEPGMLVINIGDIVQVWSNDRYHAPQHRVLTNSKLSRFSAPFFLNPCYEAVYAPLPGLLKDNGPRYQPINWGEFRAGRSAGDYADVGAEIQISDFRL